MTHSLTRSSGRSSLAPSGARGESVRPDDLSLTHSLARPSAWLLDSVLMRSVLHVVPLRRIVMIGNGTKEKSRRQSLLETPIPDLADLGTVLVSHPRLQLLDPAPKASRSEADGQLAARRGSDVLLLHGGFKLGLRDLVLLQQRKSQSACPPRTEIKAEYSSSPCRCPRQA